MAKLLPYFVRIVCVSALFTWFLSRKIGGHIRQVQPTSDKKNRIVIGTVICGKDDYMEDGLVLVKSAILSSKYHGISTNASLQLIILTEKKYMDRLYGEMRRIQEHAKMLNFTYEIHPIFPNVKQTEWNKIPKFRCRWHKMFLHNLLPHIREILYLDADTLIVGDLRLLWSKFRDMSVNQVIGMVREEEVSQLGTGRNFYKNKAHFPFYPPLGLDSGVLLMNLTRLRDKSDLDWDEAVFRSYERYKSKLLLADQDIINIVFSERPDAVLVLPCAFNYRDIFCAYGNHCRAAEDPKGRGVQILHGNSRTFHLNMGYPATRQFTMLYKYFQEFNMETGDYIQDIVHPFKMKLVEMKSRNCSILAEIIFKFYTI